MKLNKAGCFTKCPRKDMSALSHSDIQSIYFLLTSVGNFGCPCALDNQKCHRTTKNTDAVVQRTTINNIQNSPLYMCIPSTDKQKPGRTTRN